MTESGDKFTLIAVDAGGIQTMYLAASLTEALEKFEELRKAGLSQIFRQKAEVTVTTAARRISRAPRPEIEAFKKRMGWRFKWVSSFGSDFNYDYHVSFTPEEIRKGKVYYNYDVREFQVEELAGTSMFYKDANGDIFHTYSVFARGSEMLGGAYGYLDHLPKGRNETGPNHDLSDWVRHHDKYGDAGLVETTGRYVPVKG